LRESWFFISDEIWLWVFGLDICVGLAAMVVPLALAIGVSFAMAAAKPFITTLLAATILGAGSICANVWAQISLLAMASTRCLDKPEQPSA
jgi:hypothetical protein